MAVTGRHKAEVWRYDDPGHPNHGTWSWQLLRHPWSEHDFASRDGNILDVAASNIPYPTWRSAYDMAALWVWTYRYADR